MRGKKIWIIYLIMALIPTVLFLIVMPFMPDTVPIHYGLLGNVDNYGSKFWLLIMPIINIIIGVVFYISFLILGKRNSDNRIPMYISGIAVMFLMDVMFCFTLYVAYMQLTQINSSALLKIIVLILTCFFIVFGLLTPRLKRGHLVGFRTPWSLANDEVWKRTQSLGSKLLIIFSAICLVLIPFFSGVAIFMIFILSIVIVAVVVIIYSYVIYKSTI